MYGVPGGRFDQRFGVQKSEGRVGTVTTSRRKIRTGESRKRFWKTERRRLIYFRVEGRDSRFGGVWTVGVQGGTGVCGRYERRRECGGRTGGETPKMKRKSDLP